MYILIRAINLFARLLIGLICIEAVMSWFQGSFTPEIWRIYNGLRSITDPFVAPFRKLIWRFSSGSGIDFSPLVAVLAIELVQRVLINILYFVAY
ncbi:MAG: YggT family protein [Firmicutes bacterium]|nr:YggT family protein [Bacillota bacterium]